MSNPRKLRKRGVTVLVVLGLLSITLALSYALVRTQVSTTQIQGNLDRRADARQAAQAGISAALRNLTESTWAGVDTSLTGTLGTFESFRVTFTAGDPTLTPSSPDYAELPYRLTVTSTGIASNPSNSTLQAEYRIRVVVQLVRRKLSADPSNWSSLQAYTLYQWTSDDAEVQWPARVEGRAILQGKLKFCDGYPDDSASRVRYLADLETMRAAGLGDLRPFAGPIDWKLSRQTSSTLTDVQSTLKLTTQDKGLSTTSPLSHPGTVSTYRLYPGGKAYTVPVLNDLYGTELWNVSLGPDPATNPLGVLRTTTNVKLYDNVSIKGTIITAGSEPDICFYGSNVSLQAPDLPSIYGSSTRVQLPAAVVKDDLRVFDAHNASLTGFVYVADQFETVNGQQDVSFALRGRVVTSRLRLGDRAGWDVNAGTWSSWLSDFETQLAKKSLPGRILYFPTWLQTNKSLSPTPLITLKPDPANVTYHWQDWTQPIFIADPADGGLRWDLVDWKENP